MSVVSSARPESTPAAPMKGGVSRLGADSHGSSVRPKGLDLDVELQLFPGRRQFLLCFGQELIVIVTAQIRQQLRIVGFVVGIYAIASFVLRGHRLVEAIKVHIVRPSAVVGNADIQTVDSSGKTLSDPVEPIALNFRIGFAESSRIVLIASTCKSNEAVAAQWEFGVDGYGPHTVCPSLRQTRGAVLQPVIHIQSDRNGADTAVEFQTPSPKVSDSPPDGTMAGPPQLGFPFRSPRRL